MYLVDVKNGNTDTRTPPTGTLFSTDWTVWMNKWYGYVVGSKEFYVETKSWAGSGGACLGISTTVFRH